MDNQIIDWLINDDDISESSSDDEVNKRECVSRVCAIVGKRWEIKSSKQN